MSEKLTLYYFPIRGRIEPIRLMLEDTKTPYESVTPQWPGDLKVGGGCTVESPLFCFLCRFDGRSAFFNGLIAVFCLFCNRLSSRSASCR